MGINTNDLRDLANDLADVGVKHINVREYLHLVASELDATRTARNIAQTCEGVLLQRARRLEKALRTLEDAMQSLANSAPADRVELPHGQTYSEPEHTAYYRGLDNRQYDLAVIMRHMLIDIGMAFLPAEGSD